MGKEIDLNGIWKDTTDWFSSEEWKESGNGNYYFESEDGESMFVYEDNSIEDGEGTFVQMTLWLGGSPYVLQEEGDRSKTEYYFIVPPLNEHYVNPRDSWRGVVYGPDGRMEKIRNVKGLPKRIDMDKTIELFLKQVAEKDFSIPVLVKMGVK